MGTVHRDSVFKKMRLIFNWIETLTQEIQTIIKADHINCNNSNKMTRTKVKTSELVNSFFIFLFDVANLNMTTLQIKLDKQKT